MHTTTSQQIVYVFLGAYLFAVIRATAIGDLAHLAWYSGTTVLALACFLIPVILPPRIRIILPILASVCLAAVALWVLYSGLIIALDFSKRYETIPLAVNRNLFAAGIAVISICTLVIIRRLPFLLGILTLLALIFIGSRTAILAYCAALLVLLLLKPLNGRFSERRGISHIAIGVSVLLSILGLSVLLLNTMPTRNLLLHSDNLLHGAWDTTHALYLTVENIGRTVPDLGALAAWRDNGSSNAAGEYSHIVMLQLPIRSKQGKQYTASLYIRSDALQIV